MDIPNWPLATRLAMGAGLSLAVAATVAANAAVVAAYCTRTTLRKVKSNMYIVSLGE